MYVERAGGQWEAADVTVQPTGRVLVRSSASPHGQGHDITFAAIVADRLAVAIDDVVMRFGDSAEVPRGVGTFGSRSVAVAGSAVALACDDVLGRARELAAHLLEVAGDAVVFADGVFAAGERSLSWREVAAAAHQPARLAPGMDVGLRAVRRFSSDVVFSSGAYAAVVEIERATGHLDVLQIAAVDDAGTIINPLLAHGQVLGGTVQGLGECLIEEVIHDESGQLRSASLMDYSLLTAAEIPPIAIGEVSSPSPVNPLGAKGVGEGGAIGTLAAVANAVADALGGRHVDPPYLEETLWAMLREEVHMKLHNELRLEVAVEQAWSALLDVPRVARALPGAAVEGDAGPDGYPGAHAGQDRSRQRGVHRASRAWRTSTMTSTAPATACTGARSTARARPRRSSASRRSPTAPPPACAWTPSWPCRDARPNSGAGSWRTSPRGCSASSPRGCRTR